VVLSHAEILSARLRTRDEIFFCWLRDFAAAGFLGSTGRWPVGLGSLPRPGHRHSVDCAGEEIFRHGCQATAVWQPSLPKRKSVALTRLLFRRSSKTSRTVSTHDFQFEAISRLYHRDQAFT
jgi:hypothetical protein